MDQSIQINVDALNRAVDKLKGIQARTELSTALKTLNDNLPVQQSRGSTLTPIEAYQAELSKLVSTLDQLYASTIAALENAEHYFVLTDKELAYVIESSE